MKKLNVYIEELEKSAVVQVLSKYNVATTEGEKEYKVYLIKVDDDVEILHDEQENGQLTFLTLESLNAYTEKLLKELNETEKLISLLTKDNYIEE